MNEPKQWQDDTIPWHENDDFWTATAPAMFSLRRMGAATEEVEQIVRLLNVSPSAAILDLCCGPGRHSLELARWGFRVTGVDRTVGYLEKAREGAGKEGLAVEFVQDDMRHFCRPSAFDAAVMMYTSLGFFKDPAENRQVLANVYESLKAGGVALFEMMGKEVLARVFRERDSIVR